MLVKRRQLGPDGIHHIHGVGVRLTLYGKNDGLLAIEPAAGIGVVNTVGDIGDIAEVDGCAVICGHDQRAEGGRIGALGIRLDRQALIVILQCADRDLVVRLRDGGGDGIDPEPLA